MQHVGKTRVAHIVPNCSDEEGKKTHVGQVECETTIPVKLVRLPCQVILAQDGGRGNDAGGAQKCMTVLVYIQGIVKIVIRVLTAVQEAKLL